MVLALVVPSDENAELYQATIGGLGLTGVIIWAEIQLQRVHNAFINQEVIRFKNLDEFFSLARESDQEYEHTVAWVDCLVKGGDRVGPRTAHPRQLRQATRREDAWGTVCETAHPRYALLNRRSRLINGWTLRAIQLSIPPQAT